MKQTDYKILKANSDEKLARAVVAHLLDGWLLAGGHAVVLVGETYVWSQAIVRVE